jgi:hypothetical protein
MPGKLSSWPRPLFKPGGGNALLFYVVFGDFDLTKPLSTSKYRSNGPGNDVQVVQFDRATKPEEFKGYQSGPIWEAMMRDAPVTAAESQKAPQGVAVRAEVADPPTLDYFRDTIGIVTWLLDHGGVSVYDPQRLWLWSAEEWKSEIFKADEAQPQEHTVILVSEESEGTSWLHTRGMRQYGRPDLSVRGVGMKHMDEVTQMIERFINLQAEGGVIPEGQEIKMRGLPPGGLCHHRGSLDDPDFNNVHIAIEWANGAIGKSSLSGRRGGPR